VWASRRGLAAASHDSESRSLKVVATVRTGIARGGAPVGVQQARVCPGAGLPSTMPPKKSEGTYSASLCQ
jgi:hypothetical protein